MTDNGDVKKNGLKRMASVVLLLLILTTFASCNQASTDGDPSNPADGNNALITEDRLETSIGEVSEKNENSPQLRINPTTNMWEVSCDNGVTWKAINVTANEVGISGAYVEKNHLWVILSDGTKIDAGYVEAPAPEVTPDMDYAPEGLTPALVVSNASASAGDMVKVMVTIQNNPGIAGAKLIVTYDSKLTLTGVDEGSAFEFLDYTAPASLKSGCALNWDSLLGKAADDGIVVSFTFQVADTVSVGDILEIACSYIDGDVYDENIQNISLACINGFIIINS